jgi:ankyrin repeat protein
MIKKFFVNRNVKLFKYLQKNSFYYNLKNKFQVMEEDEKKKYEFIHACSNGDKEYIVNALKDQKETEVVNQTIKLEETYDTSAIMFAAQNGFYEIVDLLILYNGNHLFVNEEGYTALHNAIIAIGIKNSTKDCFNRDSRCSW